MLRTSARNRFNAYLLASALALFAVVSASKARALAAVPDPMTVVKTTIDQVLEVLRNPAYRNSPRILRERLRTTVESHLDFRAMARSALGVHWRSLSTADQDQFVTLFTRLMEDTYIGKAASYSGERVEYIRAFNDGPEYAQVNTKVIQAGHDPISINYRLELQGGDWKVYDVLVDGISLISNYRTQFNRVINRDGYPKLVEMIRSKIEQLDSVQAGK
jgi:phospholipid transport system substrate-binding protein